MTSDVQATWHGRMVERGISRRGATSDSLTIIVSNAIVCTFDGLEALRLGHFVFRLRYPHRGARDTLFVDVARSSEKLSLTGIARRGWNLFAVATGARQA